MNDIQRRFFMCTWASRDLVSAALRDNGIAPKWYETFKLLLSECTETLVQHDEQSDNKNCDDHDALCEPEEDVFI